MVESELDPISRAVNQMLRSHGLEVSPLGDLTSFVRETLEGPKELLACFRDGLVTAEEVANVVVDRAYVWATHRAGRSVASVDPTASEEAIRLVAAEVVALGL